MRPDKLRQDEELVFFTMSEALKSLRGCNSFTSHCVSGSCLAMWTLVTGYLSGYPMRECRPSGLGLCITVSCYMIPAHKPEFLSLGLFDFFFTPFLLIP